MKKIVEQSQADDLAKKKTLRRYTLFFFRVYSSVIPKNNMWCDTLAILVAEAYV
jgi:hypothetical protein